jgi:nucleotide-binding universal stress UspA family protein
VAVGIDGSRAAIGAVLWAVDEAVSRDVPLRLVYAIDPTDNADAAARDEAHVLSTAELAVRYAFTAVESTEKPVKIEVEILQVRPTLLDASRSAAMICVGSQGPRHATQGRIGSTAAALAGSAHCSVAIIRGYDPNRRPGRLVQAQLDRRLAAWNKQCPDIDVRPMAIHGRTLNYLARNAESIQLVVVGHERVRGVGDLVGPPGYAALHNTDCSVLICQPQHAL